MGDSGYSQYIVEDYLDPETQTIVSAKSWQQAVRRYCQRQVFRNGKTLALGYVTANPRPGIMSSAYEIVALTNNSSRR